MTIYLKVGRLIEDVRACHPTDYLDSGISISIRITNDPFLPSDFDE
jgi:hypothetical protein